MKKYIFLIFCIFSLSALPLSFADEQFCADLQSKITQCEQAQEGAIDWTIEDFVCIKWTRQRMAYQIVLDLKFREIDKKAEKFIFELERDKDRYFWNENFLDAIDIIEQKFFTGVSGEYYNEYISVCRLDSPGNVTQTVVSCEWGVTRINQAKDFFEWADCEKLAIQKLAVYKKVAYNVLKLNKSQVRKDRYKTFVQASRERYNTLIDILFRNKAYIQKIVHKWTTKTAEAL